MKKKSILFMLSIALLCLGCSNNQQNSSSITISNNGQTSSVEDSSNNSESVNSSNSNQTSSLDSTNSQSTSTSSDLDESNQTSSSLNISSSSSSVDSSSGGGIIGESNALYAATIENNIPENYYESCRGLSGPELKQALHDIIDDHDWYNYSETTPFYKDIDQDPFDNSKMNFIYTGVTSIGTSYNKEHIWAKSHGGFENKYPMHSDLHNLHPCNSNLNSTRGNLDFKEGGNVLTQFNGNNKIDKNVSFEPSDFSKGDTARTIFYMAVRYEGDGNEMDLELNSPSTSNYYDFSSGADGIHGNFDDLYKWATSGIDPVDDYEVSRNNKIYSDYQHNRNPFIDHPEFIRMIYDKNYDGPGALLEDNPYEIVILTPQEELEKLISYVDAIVINDISASELINKAEKYYANMSPEAQEIAVEVYQSLLEKKNQYLEFSNKYYSSAVIELINQIGEVTLDDKNLILQAEMEYEKLTDDAKNLVTNYQVLFQAREKYDELYQEWIKNHPVQPFTFDLTQCSNIPSSYTNDVTLTQDDMSFKTSHCGKFSGEFRLGSNKAVKAYDYLIEKIENLSGNSSSIESMFDIQGNKLIINYSGKYGTINNIYLLFSLDQTNWSLISTQKFSEGQNRMEFDISEYGLAKYAILIDGSTPRLILNSIVVE